MVGLETSRPMFHVRQESFHDALVWGLICAA